MMQLTKNFSLWELCRSDYAIRKGLNNNPDPDTIERLKFLASGLQEVRDLLKVPMLITSGYRSPKVNSAVGGSITSQHMKGEAADFVAPGFGTARDICEALVKSPIKFDQLIEEGDWVHVSFTETPRRSVLTARFPNGKAVYSQGLT